MGGGVSVIPDQLDEPTCRQLLGPSFDEAMFHSLSSDGFLSKSMLQQKLSYRTDVFLTHDWGGADQANHLKVSKINKKLKQLGLRTWFDEEQMQGNIKKQMVQGIDNANCVVVFITKRYVSKVCSENAGDNCQLEFNYSSLKKTASKMVAVVMEEGMRNAKLWGGEVGMVLGGNLYVDMAGDLDDEQYLNAQCMELVNAVLQRTGKSVNQFLEDMSIGAGADADADADATTPAPAASSPPLATQQQETVTPQQTKAAAIAAPAAPVSAEGGGSAESSGPRVPLSELTVEDVGALLTALKMGA